ncbi:hypothetical protein ACJJIU_03920 [Microbulbifer sp. CnH-101-E]|uniref:hypothetical protein n=1 Tax=unclassified Microbulbifer TaxID=2619833 RepID=UPI0040398644
MSEKNKEVLKKADRAFAMAVGVVLSVFSLILVPLFFQENAKEMEVTVCCVATTYTVRGSGTLLVEAHLKNGKKVFVHWSNDFPIKQGGVALVNKQRPVLGGNEVYTMRGYK